MINKLFAAMVMIPLTFTLVTNQGEIYMPVVSVSPGCNYWVAPPPLGDDDNPGSADAPWATLRHAAKEVPDDNCTIWVRDGVYDGKNSIKRRFDTPTTFKAEHPFGAILQHFGSPLVVRGGRNMIFEGFVFRHTGPDSEKMVVQVYRDDDLFSEHITLRNNIFHDSFNDDLIKIYTGSSFVTVENNIFFNQGPNEQHMDVNSVHHVVIQDNIFFNDYAGSGRESPGDTQHFIVIKDSNGPEDGLVGSQHVTVRRNVFLSYQGDKNAFIKTGNDGKPYFEAQNVLIENNLMLGDGLDQMDSPFSVRGARDVTFRNNTITGDLPSNGYAVRISISDDNPINENIHFYNNIWSDSTGTMGSDGQGDENDFANGDPAKSKNVVLDRNLYWNGGEEIPTGELIDPMKDDDRRVVADPQLETDHQNIILPRWTGTSFISGKATIREEFVRLVEQYGRIPADSPALGQADPAQAPSDDILGQLRGSTPNLGAYEQNVNLHGFGDINHFWFFWSPLNDDQIASLTLNLMGDGKSRTIENIPADERCYLSANLEPYNLYAASLTAFDEQGRIVTRSDTVLLRLVGFPFAGLSQVAEHLCSPTS